MNLTFWGPWPWLDSDASLLSQSLFRFDPASKDPATLFTAQWAARRRTQRWPGCRQSHHTLMDFYSNSTLLCVKCNLWFNTMPVFITALSLYIYIWKKINHSENIHFEGLRLGLSAVPTKTVCSRQNRGRSRPQTQPKPVHCRSGRTLFCHPFIINFTDVHWPSPLCL